MSQLEPQFELMLSKVLNDEYAAPVTTWVDYLWLGLYLGATIFFAVRTYQGITGDGNVLSIGGDICLMVASFIMLCKGIHIEVEVEHE